MKVTGLNITDISTQYVVTVSDVETLKSVRFLVLSRTLCLSLYIIIIVYSVCESV